MVNKAAVIATLIILALISLLLALAFHFYGVSVEAKGKVSQLQSDNALQAQTVATQAFNFQRSNQIAGAAQQYAVQITGKSQEREIEYRTILKSEPTPVVEVKAGVADLDAALAFIDSGVVQLGEAAKDELKELAKKHL